MKHFLGHTVNIGQLVEGMENNIRQQIESVYFGKLVLSGVCITYHLFVFNCVSE